MSEVRIRRVDREEFRRLTKTSLSEDTSVIKAFVKTHRFSRGMSKSVEDFLSHKSTYTGVYMCVKFGEY